MSYTIQFFESGNIAGTREALDEYKKMMRDLQAKAWDEGFAVASHPIEWDMREGFNPYREVEE